jgi:hypothetical protein
MEVKNSSNMSNEIGDLCSADLAVPTDHGISLMPKSQIQQLD